MKLVSILSLLLPLALFLSLTAANNPISSSSAAAAAVNLIPKACAISSKKTLCISVLNSNPTSKNADLGGLAFIALKAAANTAANTSVHIKTLLNGPIEEPDTDDGLSSCAASYLDVVDQIEDSVNALVSKAYKDVDTWMKAAIAAVKTCDEAVKELSAAAVELSAKNRVVEDLCHNALEVVHVLSHKS